MRHVFWDFFLMVVLMCSVTAHAQMAEMFLHPEFEHTLIQQAGPDNQRNNCAMMAELSDGRLMVVWNKSVAGVGGADYDEQQIWSMDSKDNGKTWANPRKLVDSAPGDLNVQAPTLLKLQSGELIMTFLRVHSLSSSTMCVMRSKDEGKTFVEEEPVYRKAEGLWLQGGANSILQLKSGRLIIPLHGNKKAHSGDPITAWCFLSDDDGKTWQRSKDTIRLPMRGAMEPSVTELSGGRLYMSLRTQLGTVFLARSNDGGNTWTLPQSTGLMSPESCTVLVTIPDTDNLLLFFNSAPYNPAHHHYGERTPYSMAISNDEGKHWEVVGHLAGGPNDEVGGHNCLFTSNGRAIIVYCFVRPKWSRSRIHLRAAIIDTDWFVKAAKSLSAISEKK
jgi:sialidase-1